MSETDLLRELNDVKQLLAAEQSTRTKYQMALERIAKGIAQPDLVALSALSEGNPSGHGEWQKDVTA